MGEPVVLSEARVSGLSLRGHHLYDPSVPVTELRGVWAGIAYARTVLHVNHLIIQDDSIIVIALIQKARRVRSSHPLLRDIALLLQGCSSCFISHIFRKTNSTADWVTFHIVHHSGQVLWTNLWNSSRIFWDLVFLNFLDCILVRSSIWIQWFYQKKNKKIKRRCILSRWLTID